VGSGVTSAISTSDYNNLYVPASSAALAFYDTGNDTTLTDWQTASGQDANSISADPLFISSTDLHVNSPAVNNTGVFVASVTTDIDGENRSNTTPDIGADEFTPLNDNIGALRFILPLNGTCGDSAVTVSVVIKNYGQDPQSGFDVSAVVSGIVVTTLTETYTSSLASNTIDTVTFATTVNTYPGGTLDITAYTSLSSDQNNDNDTIQGSFNFIPHPNTPTIASPQTVCDNSVLITGTPDSTDVLVWYDQPAGGNMLFIGNEFSPAITTDTVFYAEAHTGSGGTGCLR
jgi:hypothetical protein